jgi:dephospho-CoA kinase
MIIAFTGLKGSGKNTASEAFQEIFSKNVQTGLTVEFAFADPLKNIIHNTFNLNSATAENIKRIAIKPFNGLTLREVYQRLGEAVKKEIGPDVWAEIAAKKMQEFIDAVTPDIIVCTDLRYLNEEKHLKELADRNNYDLYIIKMINSNIIEIDSHISESQIKDISEDFLIKAADPDEIKIQIEEIYNAISE